MRKASGCLVGAAAIVALALFGSIWTFCRVYVPAGYMAIVTAKTGNPLPSGRILAEPGEKGVQRVPLRRTPRPDRRLPGEGTCRVSDPQFAAEGGSDIGFARQARSWLEDDARALHLLFRLHDQGPA